VTGQHEEVSDSGMRPRCRFHQQRQGAEPNLYVITVRYHRM
jgi:hypothetical protein